MPFSTRIRSHWLPFGAAAAILMAPAILVASTTAATTALAGSAPTASVAGPGGAAASGTPVGQAPTPTRAKPPVSTTPYQPTPAELAAGEAAMAGLTKQKAPSMGTHTSLADVQSKGGPQTVPQ